VPCKFFFKVVADISLLCFYFTLYTFLETVDILQLLFYYKCSFLDY